MPQAGQLGPLEHDRQGVLQHRPHQVLHVPAGGGVHQEHLVGNVRKVETLATGRAARSFGVLSQHPNADQRTPKQKGRGHISSGINNIIFSLWQLLLLQLTKNGNVTLLRGGRRRRPYLYSAHFVGDQCPSLGSGRQYSTQFVCPNILIILVLTYLLLSLLRAHHQLYIPFYFWFAFLNFYRFNL